MTASVAADSVTPDLVCSEQLTTRLTLRGDNIVPMPTNVLEGPARLVLPRVELARRDDLAGASADGHFIVRDDAKATSDSRLHWVSPQELAFDVTPDLALAAGLYDVIVTNPDGKNAATFASRLAAVPRPVATKIAPDIAMVAQRDETLTITGTGFLQVGPRLPVVRIGSRDLVAASVGACTPVPGTHQDGDVKRCNTVSFVLPKGSFEPGEYDVVVTNPATAACASTDVLKLRIVPPPSVASIERDLVCDAQRDQMMIVHGANMLQLGATLPTVMLGTQTIQATGISECETLPGTFVEGAALECKALAFTLPQGALSEGNYDVVVINPVPADGRSEEHVALHISPPPTVMARAAICDAEADQNVVLTGTKFLRVAGSLPTVMIGTRSFVATSATDCTAIEGMLTEGTVENCNSITVNVPKDTFLTGDYPVVVTNPTPAACASTDMVSIHVEPPPTVTSVVPGAVCVGGSKLTIAGSGFVAPPTVTLEGTGLATIASAGATVNAAGNQIVAQIGPGAQLGATYDVVVTNADSCSDLRPHRTVTVVPGPIVYFVDPEVVYSGVNMRATIYGTGVTGPVPSNAITMVPHGATAPVTPLPWTAVPGYPNRFQVTIPQGQAAGSYDVLLADATGCSAILPNALRVTATTSIALQNVVSPFGWTNSETAVTITRDVAAPAPANTPFVATPRAFLNPRAAAAGEVAIPLRSVAFNDDHTLSAVVPKGQAAKVYDLIVTNPDGTVGFLANAFTVTALRPPTLASVVPSSIVGASGQAVVAKGKDFRGSTITLACVDSMGAPVAPPAVVSGAVTCDASQNCTQPATINASTLASGSVCVLRLTNSDASYVDYSAVGVTNASLNLSTPKTGAPLNVGRRALVATSGDATGAARFVYAIGGDTGAANAATPLASTEFAPVDRFGNMRPWVTQNYTTGIGRSFAGSAKMGRYTYVFGGSDGTSNLASAQRAMILDPLEVPELDVADLVPATNGLTAGYWFYRVSATFGAADVDNPNGEGLPSDEFIVKVPSFPGKKIQVALTWTAPVDSLGAALPNVSGYRVYRTSGVNGSSTNEVLLTTTAAGTRVFTDDGSLTAGAEKPLPLGSMGRWASLPNMTVARKGAGGAAAVDPTNASKFYVYAALGLNAAGAGNTSYEYLPVTIGANGHQTFSALWTPGLSPFIATRWQLGAWAADASVSSTIAAGDTYVYFGGGLTAAGTTVGKVEAGKVAAGGDLGIISDTPKDFGVNSAGYGVCAANGQLFTFGGAGGAPSDNAKSASLVAPAPSLANNSWNDEGLRMTQQRYLLGSSVQNAFIFLVGGQTAASAASTTTELVVW